MVWLAGLVPYAQAAAIFARIGQVAIPPTSLWAQTQAVGQQWQAHHQQAQQQVGVERMVLPPAGHDHAQHKGVSLDGGMVHIRGEGWKEFKVGAVYDVGRTPAHDPITGETVDVGCAEHLQYCGVLGSVTAFAPALWALAVAHAIPYALHLAVTADGAEWIWNLVADYFPDRVQIVDWYHATEHLARAAAARYPTDFAAAQRWQRERRTALFLGHVAAITRPLEAAGLATHAHYFHTHHRRMVYQEFREQGHLIGSGSVESAIKQFKHRLTGPGMRWSRPAAEQMLLIRAAVMADNFDVLWAAALI